MTARLCQNLSSVFFFFSLVIVICDVLLHKVAYFYWCVYGHMNAAVSTNTYTNKHTYTYTYTCSHWEDKRRHSIYTRVRTVAEQIMEKPVVKSVKRLADLARWRAFHICINKQKRGTMGTNGARPVQAVDTKEIRTSDVLWTYDFSWPIRKY